MHSLMLAEEMLTCVADFHRKHAATVGDTVAIRDPLLAGALLLEEAKETRDALIAGDLVKAVDGVMDTLYTASGVLVRCGIHGVGPLFYAVHAANMRKLAGHTRGDGKILKGPGWTGPEGELANHLRALGWDGK